MTIEEYLTTSFQKEFEPEYVLGHLEEKSMADPYHGATQMQLGVLADAAAVRGGKEIFAYSEMRVRTGPSIRRPDFVLYLEPVDGNPVTQPPLATIEIVSPDDSWQRLFQRLDEFLHWGSKYVFLIDPHRGMLYDYSRGQLSPAEAIEIPEIPMRVVMADFARKLAHRAAPQPED